MRTAPFKTAAFAALAALLAACSNSNSPTGPGAAAASVVSVAPRGGAMGVSTGTAITVTFSGAMMPAMQQYMALHRDSLRGPVVITTMSWSGDSTVLTMTPMSPLAGSTTYYLHMGGGMMGANGDSVNYSRCPGLGGQPVSSGMMGGMMGGGGSEMGPGWAGGSGGYGMQFAFTTS